MKFAFKLPDAEGTVIEFYRNSFWGSVRINANDTTVFSQSAFNPLIHFSLFLSLLAASCLHYEREAAFPGWIPPQPLRRVV
jgi:hypothetical protein